MIFFITARIPAGIFECGLIACQTRIPAGILVSMNTLIQISEGIFEGGLIACQTIIPAGIPAGILVSMNTHSDFRPESPRAFQQEFLRESLTV